MPFTHWDSSAGFVGTCGSTSFADGREGHVGGCLWGSIQKHTACGRKRATMIRPSSCDSISSWRQKQCSGPALETQVLRAAVQMFAEGREGEWERVLAPTRTASEKELALAALLDCPLPG